MDFARACMRTSAIVLVVLMLAACAGGRPHGTLVATGMRAPGGATVDMLVATTRSAETAERGELFSGERGRGLRFADIVVSIPPSHVAGEVEWPTDAAPDPQRVFTAVDVRLLDKAEAIRTFDNRIRRTAKRQALIFVHGYNTRFEEAVYRFAQIVNDAGADVTPILFTWPSRGRLLQYGYDHESASYSRDALEGVLQALASDPNVGEISVLAHSMGNWVTLEALRQMAIRNRGLPDKLRNVMLAAPDVDFDVFQRQIAEIQARGSRFTLFASRDDEALGFSRRVWGDKPRVGAVDAHAPKFREAFDQDRVQVVDLTDISSGDRIGHTKFAEAPSVVQAIGARLATGQALGDGQAGIGDRLGLAAAGAVSTVGAAAGVAVAAPFAIVDPRTRTNLSDRFDSVGAQAEDALSAGADVAR